MKKTGMLEVFKNLFGFEKNSPYDEVEKVIRLTTEEKLRKLEGWLDNIVGIKLPDKENQRPSNVKLKDEGPIMEPDNNQKIRIQKER